uniref:Uncharacterized protein n=1 Tax=Anguilla anguilla TaxID=7936 RepID=A0A0E9Q2M1_ANGAN
MHTALSLHIPKIPSLMCNPYDWDAFNLLEDLHTNCTCKAFWVYIDEYIYLFIYCSHIYITL